MNFRAEIDIMPMEVLLDPQGKAVSASMVNLGLNEIDGVRIGKHIKLNVKATNKEIAKAKVDEACKKLLVNQTVESYSFSVSEA